MAEVTESFDGDDIIERCRRGDQEAARLLFNRFIDRLVAQARARLSQRIASRVDPEDIVQSVFRSFFGRLQNGEYQFEERDDVCKLLMRITLHKTLRQVAFQRAAKRSTGREMGQAAEGRDAAIDVIAHDPTPDEAVGYLDQVEHLLSKLPDEERTIIELRLQGHSEKDIAASLGVSDRKVRRINERIREMASREDWFA